MIDTRTGVIAAAMLAGLAWRLWLTFRYAAWEESDFGNLAMVRGVLDGGFLHYDMHHLPGYYALGAVALAVVGDTLVAARATSMIGGVIALGLSVALTDRLAGRRAAQIAALLLVFQPEFALYAASSLREPVYAAFAVGALLALVSERLALAGALAGAAFLVRMDAAAILCPVLVVHALSRPGGATRALRALLPLASIIGLWALYCRFEHGTAVFWGHTVAVNLETGLGQEATSRVDWAIAGLDVSLRLLGDLLPSRIGWGIWAGLLLAWVSIPWLDPGGRVARRTWALAALGFAGFWAAVGFVGQHSPEHNLYWKWLAPVVPFVVPLGVSGLLGFAQRVRERAGRLVAVALVAVCVAQACAAYLLETRRQVQLSAQLYQPQLDLGKQVEAQIPEGVPLLLDNIPACWIDRRPHERQMVSWFDVPTSGEAAFAAWLLRENIGWVLWFREDWTQAPRVAPFLAAGGTWQGAGVLLEEIDREDGYGWIWFQVVSEEIPE